jgi:hypothetical protein
LALLALALAQNAVSVDFTRLAIGQSTLRPTLQVVVNPLIQRSSPIHNQVFNNLATLNTQMTRFVPWFPYPELVVAELEAPDINPICEVVPEGQWMYLNCPKVNGTDTVISKIQFASYGNPTGVCGNFQVGSCNLPASVDIIEDQCVGFSSCLFPINDTYVPDPCSNETFSKWLAVQATCSAVSGTTSWNFTLIDPLVEDFLNATGGRNVTINFSTQPEWMWVTPGQVKFTKGENVGVSNWAYEQGTSLRDPTLQQVATYYKNLLSWYTKGGFVDEAGVTHKSGHYYDISHWECLNEVDAEHAMSKEFYTQVYDAMANAMREVQPTINFVGMALAFHREFDWYEYFLNASNHVPGTPINLISFHFYASCDNRTDPNSYMDFFPQSDGFVEEVAEIVRIRDALNPTVELFIDEVGVILPGDNDEPPPPDFPLVYWNAAGAAYAYLFGQLAELGVSWLGMSQLVGYPSQFPSVAMLNWTSGAGTARYWTLSLLLEHYGQPGGLSFWPAYSSAPVWVYAQAFQNAAGEKSLLLVSKVPVGQNITLTLDWTNANIQCVDESTGFGPARSLVLTDPEGAGFLLWPYAVCVAVYPTQEPRSFPHHAPAVGHPGGVGKNGFLHAQ